MFLFVFLNQTTLWPGSRRTCCGGLNAFSFFNIWSAPFWFRKVDMGLKIWKILLFEFSFMLYNFFLFQYKPFFHFNHFFIFFSFTQVWIQILSFICSLNLFVFLFFLLYFFVYFYSAVCCFVLLLFNPPSNALVFIFNLGLGCKHRSRPDGDWKDWVSFMYVSKMNHFHFGLD